MGALAAGSGAASAFSSDLLLARAHILLLFGLSRCSVRRVCYVRDMGKIGALVRMVSLVVVAPACGSNADADWNGGSSGGSVPSSGGSAIGGSATGGSAQSSGGSATGGSREGSGGGDSGLPKQCETVDERLAYGPIGEPWPLLLVSAVSDSRFVEQAFGFRIAAGYGFVFFDTSVSSGQTLFSLSVDSNFQGGELASIAEISGWDFDVTVAPNGFIVAICTREDRPKWIQLSGDLLALEEPNIIAPDVPCGLKAPRVVWTGEVYLTSFTDARGLVVASLDEQGVLVGEAIVSEEVDEPVITYFSKNADRVLFVFGHGLPERGWYSVLDLQGTPLGDVQPIGEGDTSSWGASVVTRGDGWWVLGDNEATNDAGGLLTAISREGLVGQEARVLSEAVWPGTFVPSAYGGSLLVADWSEVSLFAHTFATTTLINDAGEVAFSKQTDFSNSVGSWPIGIVVDPLRDLVIERQELEGSEPTLVVQEYGCLE
jgi:hypothetical protein